MSQDIEFSCRCGQLHGCLRAISEHTVQRVICYCDDCRALLHQLGRVDLIDPRGGVDVIQVPPASLDFDRGTERIVALRLSPKGPYRWYASCCGTPLGGTIARPVPFIPMCAGAVLADATLRDEIFGKPRGAIFTKFALGGPAPELPKFGHLRRTRYLDLVLRWMFSGKTWPNPFFDQPTRTLRYPLAKTLSTQEREALRH